MALETDLVFYAAAAAPTANPHPLRSRTEHLVSTDRSNQGRRIERPDAGDRHQHARGSVGARLGGKLVVTGQETAVQFAPLGLHVRNQQTRTR